MAHDDVCPCQHGTFVCLLPCQECFPHAFVPNEIESVIREKHHELGIEMERRAIAQERASQVHWMITMEAVYDHGIGGIFTDKDAAVAHARALAADSDGHHDFRVDPVTINEPVWPKPRWPSWFRNKEKVQKRKPHVYVEGELDAG